MAQLQICRLPGWQGTLIDAAMDFELTGEPHADDEVSPQRRSLGLCFTSASL
jgi:hypothetical protein